jgi:hypothetical protein
MLESSGACLRIKKVREIRVYRCFSAYFFAGFFFFPLVFLGTIVASNFDFNNFLFKFVSVTKPACAYSHPFV